MGNLDAGRTLSNVDIILPFRSDMTRVAAVRRPLRTARDEAKTVIAGRLVPKSYTEPLDGVDPGVGEAWSDEGVKAIVCYLLETRTLYRYLESVPSLLHESVMQATLLKRRPRDLRLINKTSQFSQPDTAPNRPKLSDSEFPQDHEPAIERKSKPRWHWKVGKETKKALCCTGRGSSSSR